MARAAKRSVDDAGDKIGGARKDWRERAMTAADLDSMTAAEAAMLVTKDNVWPQPDYEALVANGAEPLVAAMIKIVRDRMAARPRQTRQGTPEEAARQFIEMVTIVRAELEACGTFDVVRVASRRINEAAGYSGMRSVPADVQRRIWSVYKGRACPYHIDHSDIRKANEMVQAGFPTKADAWKRGHVVREFMGKYSLYKGRSAIARDFDSEAAAWAYLRGKLDTKAASRAASDPAAPADPDRPHLGKLRREGPDTRGGRDISPDEFIAEFGFRAVEFGLWLADGERQEVLNLGWDACCDLADILGIPREDVGLVERLAVAFGARGSGGFAAHYEPGRQVFNLTRLRGAGSAAHEYVHGLDHFIGVIGGGEIEGKEPRFASGFRATKEAKRGSALPNLPPQMVDAIENLMNVIRTRPKTREEAITETEERICKIRASMDRCAIALEKAKAKPDPTKGERTWIHDTSKWLANAGTNLEVLGARIEKIRNGQILDLGTVPSNFIKEAMKLNGPSGTYWTRPLELVARAGESAIFDALREQGRVSDYLVHGVEDGRFSGEHFKGDPYPAGEERQRINAAFKAFFREIAPFLAAQRAPDAAAAPA